MFVLQRVLLLNGVVGYDSIQIGIAKKTWGKL